MNEYRETTYDEDGLKLSRAMYGDDDIIDVMFTYVHDADGALQTMDHDHGHDGEIDAQTTYTYDALGYPFRVETDEGLDGTLDSWSETVYGTACIEDATTAS